MNAIKRSTLALAAGVAIGVAGMAALEAQQAKAPPAYVVSNIDVTDAKAFPEYAEKIPPIVAAHNGHFLVRGGKTESFAGEAPKRVVIIAFDSMEDAIKYRHSAEYQKLEPERAKVLNFVQNFAVEGATEPMPAAVGSSTPPKK